jgi:Protein of unknown function (DUF3631)
MAAARGVMSRGRPEPTPSTLVNILHHVRAFIHRYVVLTSEQSTAVTLWTSHTHVIAAADCTPYLQITSATAEAGKTRLLEVEDLLVAEPWLTGRTSAAALVRKVDADSPTLLLDESDAAFNGEKEYAEALRGILNTGYRRSGKSTLCIGQGANLTFRDFSTFCAKAIAGIGKLPDTVVSRAIRIELRRRMKAEPVAKFRERDARIEADPIRAALIAWANKQTIATLKAARPSMPAGLRDRAEDVWEPLVSIADLAGGDWPDQARRAALALMGSTEEQDINIELLHDISAVFEGTTFIKSTDLAKKLGELDDRPWSDWKNGKPITTRAVADRLKPFGIVPGKNERDDRGYHRDRFEDAWARYPHFKPSNRRNLNENGPEVAISNRQNGDGFDGLKMQETSIKTGLFDGSTVCEPGSEENRVATGTEEAGKPPEPDPPFGISREARHHVKPRSGNG